MRKIKAVSCRGRKDSRDPHPKSGEFSLNASVEFPKVTYFVRFFNFSRRVHDTGTRMVNARNVSPERR